MRLVKKFLSGVLVVLVLAALVASIPVVCVAYVIGVDEALDSVFTFLGNVVERAAGWIDGLGGKK